MKRLVPLIVLALVVGGFAAKRLWWPGASTPAHFLGYVEGETTLISPPVAGRLVSRAVSRGDTVVRGASLFAIDPAAADAQVARFSAAVAEANAQLENIMTGKRDVELEVIRQQRAEAEASLSFAEDDLKRASELVVRGNATRVRVDQAKSQVAQLQARVAQLKAQEAASDLPGRTNELRAAQSRVTQAKANLAEAMSHQSDLAPVAPLDAQVDDTFFDVGEWVGAGQPVVSLLATDKIKLRFFVPEAAIGQVRIGSAVTFTWDGGPPAQKATVSFVAPRAEFTPPVIYSDSARQKLVFLVEAKPAPSTPPIRPGLPVEVALTP